MAENNFDKLIGKNGELAELRKEQVLAGAIGIIRRQYAGRRKMEAIAALCGKKLDERFTFVYHGGTYDAKFTTAGLWVFYDFIDFDEAYEALMLKELLTGEAQIVEGK